MKSDNPGLGIFVYQVPKVLNQAAPVQDTFYPIGLADAEMVNARIYAIGVNIEDVNEDLECQILADGETILGETFAATHSTSYLAYMMVRPIGRLPVIILTDSITLLHSFILDGRSLEVEVRKTSAAGAGNLTGIVLWGQKKN